MDIEWRPGEIGEINKAMEDAREQFPGVSIMLRESDRGLELIMRPYKVWQYISSRTITYEELITSHVTVGYLVTRTLQDMYKYTLEALQAAGKTLEG
jgi:hypothetical protein